MESDAVEVSTVESDYDLDRGVETTSYRVSILERQYEREPLPRGKNEQKWFKDLIEANSGVRPEGILTDYQATEDMRLFSGKSDSDPVILIDVDFQQPISDMRDSLSEVVGDVGDLAAEATAQNHSHPAQAAGDGSSTEPEGPECPVDGCTHKLEGELHDHMIDEHGWYDPSMEDQI